MVLYIALHICLDHSAQDSIIFSGLSSRILTPFIRSTVCVSLPSGFLFSEALSVRLLFTECGWSANTTRFVSSSRYFRYCIYSTHQTDEVKSWSSLYEMRSFMIFIFDSLVVVLTLVLVLVKSCRSPPVIKKKLIYSTQRFWGAVVVYVWANFQYHIHSFTWVVRSIFFIKRTACVSW